MSLNGTSVFSSGTKTDFDIWTLDLSTKSLKQLTTGTDYNSFPRWSPDGSRIAYISMGSDYIASLYVMDGNGRNKKRLTNNIHCQTPDWHPDGNKILFVANSSQGGEEFDICLYDLEKNSYETLFQRPGVEEQPSFSPDGKKIIFSSTNENSNLPFSHRDTEIWERDLRTGEERIICSHPAQDHAPVYSPDGKHIAFISHRNDRDKEKLIAEIKNIHSSINPKDIKTVDAAIVALQNLDMDSEVCVVNVDGTNLRQLTFNNGLDAGVRWSPCGKYLVYSSAPKDRTSIERLKIIEVETGNNIPLEYNRDELMREIGSDPNKMLNRRLFLKLLPDCIEKPFTMWVVGKNFFGEEHQPDWTSAKY